MTWGHTYKAILSKEQIEYMFELMYSEKNIRKQMEEGGHLYFVTEKDNTPVGYLSIEPKSDCSFVFQKVYVIPSAQGGGIGRYMIKWGISYLKERYPIPFSIELYVNRKNPAVKFYKQIGFEIINTRDHDIGNGFYMNDYVMRLVIL